MASSRTSWLTAFTAASNSRPNSFSRNALLPRSLEKGMDLNLPDVVAPFSSHSTAESDTAHRSKRQISPRAGLVKLKMIQSSSSFAVVPAGTHSSCSSLGRPASGSEIRATGFDVRLE